MSLASSTSEKRAFLTETLRRCRGRLHRSNGDACCSWCIECSVPDITVSTFSPKRRAAFLCPKTLSTSRFSRRNRSRNVYKDQQATCARSIRQIPQFGDPDDEIGATGQTHRRALSASVARTKLPPVHAHQERWTPLYGIRNYQQSWKHLPGNGHNLPAWSRHSRHVR